ncbi:MAG: NapC/NirT family cytochrome c [Candidatus Delongbacteria bacterium]|nr:NapC/NirT family cytochrome c [Candidatus Delongbacteria bacterium]MBN2835891.1 NapC/NirT family cytochrome c [Candidatus Delongbacteria bacterium]
MTKKVLYIIIGIIFGAIISIISAEMIEHTSDINFCSSCHSMKGVSESYLLDVHGGNSKHAVKAKCADCHLPHNNVTNYLITKGYTGAKDVLGEIFWAESFDWVKNLENRQEFTYSSGCLKCHDIENMKYEIPKAFIAHKDFREGKVRSCVECHEHVGHKNIKNFLTINKEEK